MKFKTKLLLFNFSIIVSLTALTIFLGYDFLRIANLSSFQRSIEGKVESTAGKIAKNAEIGLATENNEELKQVIEPFKSDSDLAFIYIYDKNEKQIIELHSSLAEQSEWDGRKVFKQLKVKAPGKIHDIGEHSLVLWTPVELEGVRLGSIVVGYSRARISTIQNRIFFFALLVFIAALLSGLASYTFAGKITRPIVLMTSAFKQMAAGDLDQERVEVHGLDETSDMARAFNEMLEILHDISHTASAVAQGDLNVKMNIKGDLAIAFQQMLLSQKEMVNQIRRTAVQLTTAVNEFQANAEQQERGAIEQSSAVEENRRTLDSLLESARKIGEKAQGVLQNAEKTQNNNRLVAERIAELSSKTQHIADILQVIKEIANKSDLLALNAALEGTKAGETGRGFSLVANQMQRLAENVMDSVRDIKELTSSITEATRTTVLATEGSTKIAADTTKSARQIVMIIQQQQTGTEQVTKAMDEVSRVAREAASGSREIVISTKDLVQLSKKLQGILARFHASEPAPGGTE